MLFVYLVQSYTVVLRYPPLKGGNEFLLQRALSQLISAYFILHVKRNDPSSKFLEGNRTFSIDHDWHPFFAKSSRSWINLIGVLVNSHSEKWPTHEFKHVTVFTLHYPYNNLENKKVREELKNTKWMINTHHYTKRSEHDCGIKPKIV